MRNGDRFQPVKQRHRCREELRAHMATEAILPVHGHKQSPGETRVGNQARPAWSQGTQKAIDFIPDYPFGAHRVEDGEETDVVCLLADSPFVVVILGLTDGRRWAAGLDTERRRFTYVVDGKRAPDSFVFAPANRFPERMRGGTVQSGNIESCIALPHTPSRLVAGELSDFVDELIVVACVSRVDFPVPEVFELGMSQGEVLDREPLCVVDTVTVNV